MVIYVNKVFIRRPQERSNLPLRLPRFLRAIMITACYAFGTYTLTGHLR